MNSAGAISSWPWIRATRWVFVRIHGAKTAANARRFLRDFERVCPIRITRILADNGKEFTDRLFGLRKRAATGQHEFDRLCADHSPLSLGPMARHGSSSRTASPHRCIPNLSVKVPHLPVSEPMAWSSASPLVHFQCTAGQ
jgi:hypothetical protein